MTAHVITMLLGIALGVVLGPNVFLLALVLLVATMLARQLASYDKTNRARDLPPGTAPELKRFARTNRLALPAPIERRWL